MKRLSVIVAVWLLAGVPVLAQNPVTIPNGGDVTQGAKADAKSTATDTTAITLMQVFKEISFMEQNPASRAVTNAGTFAVQATGSGNFTVVQATGSNLHTVFDNTTLAVTGTFFQTTQPISAAALPLPALAATSTKQSDGTQKTQVVDGSGNVIGATSNALDINIKSGNPTTITVTQATGTNLHAVLDANSGVDIGKLTANQSVNLAQVGGTNTVTGGVNGTQAVGGCVATNTATPCNPIGTGGIAVTSEPSAATATREVNLIADKVGKLIVLPYANPENAVSGVTAAMTGTTSTSVIASPGGSLRNYLTQLTCTNSHATVGTFVLVQDGNGGTTIYEAYAAAVGGGFAISFPVPLVQPTTATALYVQDVTTGANVICSASGYKGL